MTKFTSLQKEINDLFKLEEVDIGPYRVLKYPAPFSIMKMEIHKYKIEDFGYLMIMNTSMLGLMRLTTLSFTPSSGKNVPYLLIDTMAMGKKRLAYVEFYNTTHLTYPTLEDLSAKYQDIPNYNEHDAWYVKERMKGSLIKCGDRKLENQLFTMIIDAIKTYKTVITYADKNNDNLNMLRALADRMMTEGNPSSKTLNKVLGPEKAQTFFKEIIMPLS